MWTTPELAPPLLTTTPHQREDVSALDRLNVHRCPTRSSINTLLQLQHDIILARERKEYFILVALDIKAAYDSVWPNGLISELKLDTLVDYYDGFKTSYIREKFKPSSSLC
ncbi:hypothetical protein TNCV_463011 [Trichonephila clavipes]|nr:hypothetical protein TNCV_463011 [Trichonephila clavipes]